MIHFIGGAARSGKGILTRRLLHDQRLPYLSLDVLKMGLTRGMPELAIDPDAGGLQVAERLWPLVREMSYNLLADEEDYVFEGEIVPKDVDVLRQQFPKQARGYFLGYSAIEPGDKLRQIREHSGFANDWPQEYNDAGLLRIIEREIGFSRYLEAECARLDFPYFDLSRDFEKGLDAAAAAVSAGSLNGRESTAGLCSKKPSE